MMKLIVYYIILFMYSTAKGQAQAEKDYYTGAIVEYAPVLILNASESPEDSMGRNVDEYLIQIQKAKKQDADIILFPELGLISPLLPKNVADLQLYGIVMPNPKEQIVVPCDSDEWADVLKRLSCAAKENKIYVVANTPERRIIETTYDGEKIAMYNTNIVFDRTGAIIARYRKQNLFVEPAFSKSDAQDYTTFETDFGVTFGTFICFDILFFNPGLNMLKENPNITDIAFLTSWFIELPFASAVPVQAGWARANGVNLLASNFLNPTRAKGGSGIFLANGDISYSVPVYNKTTLIVKRIPKLKQRVVLDTIDRNTAKIIDVNKNDRSEGKMFALKENISNYTTVLINDTNIEQQIICYGTFCCTFTIKFTPIENADYHYRMIVYDGPRYKPFSLEIHNIQICGLAACSTTSSDSCGERTENTENPKVFQEISITGTFRKDENCAVLPTNTLYDLSMFHPSDFVYRVSGLGTDKTILVKTTQEVKQVLGFGIFGIAKKSDVSFSYVTVICFNIITFITLFMIVRKFK